MSFRLISGGSPLVLRLKKASIVSLNIIIIYSKKEASKIKILYQSEYSFII